MRMPQDALNRIFNSALGAVLPPALVQNHLKRCGDVLTVGSKTYKLQQNVHVVGSGKAVSGMCRAVQQLLGDHIVQGIISVPYGTSSILEKAGKSFLLPDDDGKILMCEGAKNNMPDEACFHTTEKITSLLRGLTEDDIVITLLSGGGSALLCSPIPPLTLVDKMSVTSLLAKQGASIQELNTIRKSLSTVKGGGLAQMAYPSKMIALILSDIIGDPLDLIASGPTVITESSVDQRKAILDIYGLSAKVPDSVKTVLNQTRNTVANLQHVQNVLVGTNAIAVDAAVKEAELAGYETYVLSKRVEGEARDIGVFLVELGAVVAELASEQNLGRKVGHRDISYETLGEKYESRNWAWICDINDLIEKLRKAMIFSNNVPHKICIIAAGETTVTVKGNGTGGRNQEIVLAAAIHHFKHPCDKNFKLWFLSAGTDGQDGPTDAAGACFASDSNFIRHDSDLALAEQALSNNDSYNFLNSHPDCLLKTGLTGTNVMDLQILTIEPV